jgi:DNA repair ATPase RecN
MSINLFGDDDLIDVLSQSKGAQFYRADLHIHSYGSSHDVADSTMTPAAIVSTAAREKLSLIALTDHNEITNVAPTMEAASRSNICVIPGIELSTPQGHLLCYLPTLEALQRFHGRLSIVDRGQPNSRCQQSIHECLDIVQTQGGFGILAHVDIPSGYEVEVPGASPHKIDVLCHPALRGVELKHAESTISYAPGDDSAERVRIGETRIQRQNLGSKQYLARVLNSDSHTLQALGRNAVSARRVTRYKMDAPSFAALCVALEDADARVRIEDLIPQTVPRILGVKLNGGFLDGQTIQFSPNLNCIIGGRGTGKSTTFEAVRCLTGDAAESKVVDSEVWPEELHLFWEDQAGQQHTLYRPKDGAVTNLDDEDNGPRAFEIDCFGQGEAARISLQAQSDPLALLHYLDKFVDLDEALEAEEKAREALLNFQTEIEKSEQKVALIPQYERLLATTKQQLAALQKPEVKELIELQRKIANEKTVRQHVADALQEAKKEASGHSLKKFADQIKDIAVPEALSVGGTEFRAIVTGAAAFSGVVNTAETQIRTGLTSLESTIATQMALWRQKEAEAQKKIDAKRRELEAMKISFDMSYIAKLAADEAQHEQTVKNLNTWKPHLASQGKQRAAALADRWKARARVAALRAAFGAKASKILRETLSDLQVSLKFSTNAHSPDAAELIIAAMGWRTNQQVRAAYLTEALTVPSLLDAINKNDINPLFAIRTVEGVQIFKSDEAAAILERLSEPTTKFALERIAIYDLPRLQVTRQIEDGNGQKKYLHRDFAKLSLGQQQSVLLALMLSADSSHPLIIDQPEDNLDGEFIYSTLVPVLRRAKERRQVIIVTHNPNVAVLGDAELIVVLKAFNDQGTVVSRGSIDNADTRLAACAILEGAEEAFRRRAKMYGMQIK